MESQFPEYDDAHLDRSPPANVELEMCVLGGIMLEPREAYQIAADYLQPEYFYIEGHRVLFGLMGELHARGIPPDCNVILDELYARKLDRIVPKGDVLAMLNSVPSAAGVATHSQKVAEKAHARALQRILIESTEDIYRQDLPLDEVLGKIELGINMISKSVAGDESSPAGNILVDYWAEMSERWDRQRESGQDELAGLSSGFTQLDLMSAGFQPQEMTIIAARPSVGKTALGLNICHRLAVNHNIPVLFFSLEMSKQRLGERLLCSGTKTWMANRLTGVSPYMLRTGRMAQEYLNVLTQSYNELLQAPLHIDDTGGITIQQLCARSRRLANREGIKLIVVDYLQLVETAQKMENQNLKVAFVSAQLKKLAKSLKIPVIALSQLNRQSEGTADKRPQLCNLRDSGAIEQDADVVMFLHREGKAKEWREAIDYTAVPMHEHNLMPVVELIVAKNRNGPCGDMQLRWFPEITRFLDMERM